MFGQLRCTPDCQQTLGPACTYEGMIITRMTGLTEAEVVTLKTLEALEVD